MDKKVYTALVLMAVGLVAWGIWQYQNSEPDNIESGTVLSGKINPANTTWLIEGEKKPLLEGTFSESPFDDPEEFPGSAIMETTVLSNIAQSDLDRDGREDAAGLLAFNAGGTGVFVYLGAVLNTAEGEKPVEAVLLGDRVKIESFEIEKGTIKVEYFIHGPEQAMAEVPNQAVGKQFIISGSKLKEVF